jgi:two-component system, OmpR family, response regulator
MPGTSTIAIAREDLSIPGMEEAKHSSCADPSDIERRFFELVRDNRPDVVVLDLSNTRGNGVEAILKIRQRCAVPVLVVCEASDPRAHDYRIAGAAECISAPVDIVLLNEAILNIKRVIGAGNPAPTPQPEAFAFAGMTFRPDQSALSGPNGSSIKLTTSENDLLSHFLSRARAVCSRAEIAETLYGRHRPTSDRAIDIIVNRLRKKLASLQGPSADDLVKTKFRRGYLLAARVSAIPESDFPRQAFRDA